MRRLATLLATAAVVLAAGCGLRDDAGAVDVAATADFLAASADRTAEAGTGRFELVVELSGVPQLGPSPIRITGDGVYDAGANRASMTMDLSAFVGVLADEGGEDADEAAQALAEPLQTVIDGTTVYLRFPLLAASAGGSEAWVRMDVAEAEATGGVPVSPSSLDPRALLDFLYGVAGDVEEVGTEDVRDVPTTHLRATVSPDDIVEALPESDRQRVQAVLDAFSAAQVGSFPLDVWVDRQGQVRRVEVAYEIPAASTGADEDVRTSVTVDYFGFGEDVTVEIPPDDDVVDGSELFGGSGGD